MKQRIFLCMSALAATIAATTAVGPLAAQTSVVVAKPGAKTPKNRKPRRPPRPKPTCHLLLPRLLG